MSNWLTPLNRDLHDVLTVPQPANEFPANYATRRSIIMFTIFRHFYSSWARLFQSPPFHPNSLRCIFNIIPSSAPGPSMQSISYTSTPKFCVYFSSPPCMLHAHLSYPPCFGHLNYHKACSAHFIGVRTQGVLFSFFFTGEHYWTLNNKEQLQFNQQMHNINLLYELYYYIKVYIACCYMFRR